MGVDKFNHEGYFDPTTYEALTNIHRGEMAADKKAAYLPLVYVCSPYVGDVETNVKNAKRYSRFAVDENAIPVTPHLLYPQFMDDGNEAERDMAMHFNYVLLGKCTEVWVFGGVISRGMAREIGVVILGTVISKVGVAMQAFSKLGLKLTSLMSNAGGLSRVMGKVGAAIGVITGILDVFIGIFTGNWLQVWEGLVIISISMLRKQMRQGSYMKKILQK